MSLDFDKKLDIDIETEKIDIATIPEKIRSTHRFLLKFISVSPYSIDANCTIYITYKNLTDNTEFSLNFTMDKNKTVFKKKLPLGILAREWRVRITGTGLEQAEFGQIEVLWLPKRIGNR